MTALDSIAEMPSGRDAAPRRGQRDLFPSLKELGEFKALTDVAACLIPLLKALNWYGNPRHVSEALPHFANSLDLDDLRNVMANLNYESRASQMALDELDPRALPALYVPTRGSAMVVLRLSDGQATVFNGGSGRIEEFEARGISGTGYFFRPQSRARQATADKDLGWVGRLVRRFRPLLTQVVAISLLTNLLSLVAPLFVMAVYDRVVGTGSLRMLETLAIGLGIALACDLSLRLLRSRIVAFLGGRVDNIVGNAVFRHILFLPAGFTERAAIGTQVARIKDFDSVRDFATGPMTLTLLELPFSFVFIVVIAILGGPLAFIPLVMIVGFILIGWFLATPAAAAVAETASAAAERQAFLIEALSNLRALKHGGATGLWLDRFRAISSRAAFSGYRTAQISAVITAVSQFIMMSAGLATVAFGVLQVLDGEMSVGALVATMVLVWRSLAPLQLAFLSLPRLAQVRASLKQVDALMQLPQEVVPDRLVTPLNDVRGRVTFANVFFRYGPDSEPALSGVNFSIEPGQIVAVVGANGSGKSTALKLVLGLQQPQGGAILVDNQDIRQCDPLELRQSIAYAPQSARFFYGTIAQNLRLADPVASDADLVEAARQAAVLDDILALPEGFDTRIGDSNTERLPPSFRQRLNLARCYLKDAPILLLDEPGNALDMAADRALLDTLSAMRGRRTVFIVTHRPSHLNIADAVVWLQQGRVRAIGPPDKIRPHLPSNFL